MSRSVTILGAGLVGSLLATVLRKRGHDVTIYERRPDMRTATGPAGRSINLAMSVRGWAALELAGLREDIEELALPMTGRFLHQADGTTAFQPYGTRGEAIYSVSRGELNKRLMTVAEREGATIHFNHRCTKVDVATNRLQFETGGAEPVSVEADVLAGADGAFSALRTAYTHLDRVNAAQHYIEHGYKELTIPAGPGGSWQIAKDALHIWPRRSYMMIALPNVDGSFTCTLFMPFEGERASFAALQDEAAVTAFFNEEFPDAVALMPTLVEDFFHNPTASLITTHIEPWTYHDKSFLIGDAAHAIVPFYGQGMNAGFEDVSVLTRMLDAHGDDWSALLTAYGVVRKPSGDAVAALALQNFTEMRDKVADPVFLERKRVEKVLTTRYPDVFKSVYEMVSFSHTPYETALKCTEAQDRLWERLQNHGTILEQLDNPAYTGELDAWMDEYHGAVKDLDFGGR